MTGIRGTSLLLVPTPAGEPEEASVAQGCSVSVIVAFVDLPLRS